ncbi:MAG: hypothetical protein H7X88_13035 [Gloeobacteraceae cyanobacterium ES-bin-316]|nr:hypothetical protein [Ferruginibacter sp.]
MQPTPPTELDKALNLDFAEKDTIWLQKQDTLRRLVGLLGIGLPVLLYLGLWIDTGHYLPITSISHYYLTRVGSLFVIIVSLLAIFLLVYKGKDRLDFYLSSLAGLSALCVLLFPTNNIVEATNAAHHTHPYAVTILKVSDTRMIFHFIAAAIFLLSLAAMSFFLFTKSDKPKELRTREKKIRNRIYRTTAVIMVLAIAVIFSSIWDLIDPVFYNKYALTFWMEAIAVWSFGISWLIKGKMMMKDE